MRIITDYREKRPFTFEGFDAEIEAGALLCGDYSVKGLEKLLAVERKSLDDLSCCIGRDRERFQFELRRAQKFRCFAVICEGSFSALERGDFRASVSPAAAVASVMSWQAVFRIPFFFAGSRADAERATYEYLRQAVTVCRKMKQGSLI